MNGLSDRILLAFKGMAMGIAEVIPGVSGGTIAFITGIYEELLTTIKSILGPEIFKGLKRGGLPEAWKVANGIFLLFLMGGMACGLVIGVFGVTHLMEFYPVLIWSLFFGLILASTVVIARKVKPWRVLEILAALITTGLTYYITVATPAQGPQQLWFVFVAGAIAISALMLPGISGSLMLLLMGMYTYVMGSVKGLLTGDFAGIGVVIAFALGCLVGLGTFSRVLTWLFKHHGNVTLAALAGFMLGSLNKIWPWRNVLETRIDSSGEEVPLIEQTVLPAQYTEGDPMLLWAILLMLAGIGLVIVIEIMSHKDPVSEPEQKMGAPGTETAIAE